MIGIIQYLSFCVWLISLSLMPSIFIPSIFICVIAWIRISILFIYFFRVTPEAYGSSQGRGQIGAMVAHLHHSHSNAGSSHFCNLHPLNKAKDWTHFLMDTSQVCYHWATMRTPSFLRRTIFCCMYRPHSVDSSANGHLGWFHVWLVWIMLLWIWVDKYLFKSLLLFFGGNIFRSRIAGSYRNSIFNFLRKYLTVFHSGYTILHFHQQYIGIPIISHPC